MLKQGEVHKQAEESQTDINFPIVGIGASAGGLEAFINFLKALDPNTGMSFVLIQHLDPTHPSSLGEILSKETTIPVLVIENGMKIKPNCIFVLPSNTRVVLKAERLELSPRCKTEDEYYPIDHFFFSLALEKKNEAIGIVLSGTGTDGAKGIAAISSAGGITFAQDKNSAKFDSMPKAAIEAGVDFVLSPEEIAQELTYFTSNTPHLTKMIDHNSEEFHKILECLHTAKGVNFNDYKPPTIQRRILSRMKKLNISKTSDYLDSLKDNTKEIDTLFEDLLIKVTDFFRNPECFTFLKKEIFPLILKSKKPPQSLRIWVPGCSTGEEAYSLAICLLESMEELGQKTKIEIFATDISEKALSIARSGFYAASCFENVSSAQLSRFFIKENQGYRVSPIIRELCIFAKQNLIKDPPFSKLDLISCRNLLIYLNPPCQRKILASFHFALLPSAYLLLGNARKSRFSFQPICSL